MITLKLKYITKDSSLVLQYQRQYSNCLHFVYNRISDNHNITEIELRNLYSNINNCSLINKWLYQCAIKEAKQIYNSHGDKVIFGGKSNFYKRNKLKIEKDEYVKHRLSPIYSIGEAFHHGNRMFELTSDSTIIFKPNKDNHFNLQLIGLGKRKEKIMSKLYSLSKQNKITITYKLSSEYIWISYDEKLIDNINSPKIKDRVFAIDMNPNYIGWSIIDWKNSNTFKVINKGVISIKELNDYDRNKKIDSANRKYISNIRRHDILEISKYLIDLAVYYRCSIFGIEDLSFKGKNKKETSYNRLTKNQWCRDLLVLNLNKRCNIYNIQLIKIEPAYTSFIGNILYRNIVDAPDMVLASIEISRRVYEFNGQYIEKKKEKQKNIIFPDLNSFADIYVKSLEEFNIYEKLVDMKTLYSYIKNAKITYRVPIKHNLIGFRFRSLNRFVYTYNT